MKTHAHIKVSDLESGLSEEVSQVTAALPVIQVSKLPVCALNPLHPVASRTPEQAVAGEACAALI